MPEQRNARRAGPGASDKSVALQNVDGNKGNNRRARRQPDADQVREAARGRWPEILPRCGVPAGSLRNRHQPCPGCGGRDRFRFDDRRIGSFICSQGSGDNLAGDGFDLIQHVTGCRFPEAVKLVADVLGMGADDPPPATTRPAPAPAPAVSEKRTTLAPQERERWAKAKIITPNNVAGGYLQGRGCVLPPAEGDLRWHPRVKHKPTGHVGPALVALITDYRTCEPVTLHFTWIRADGAGKADLGEHDPRRTLGGHTNAGVIRLWPDEEVTQGLALAEGVESALTVARGFTPVWATTVSNNMKNFPHLPGVEALTILADNDDAGIKAARECADRWAAAGAEVRLWRAQQEGADPNDVWRAA